MATHRRRRESPRRRPRGGASSSGREGSRGGDRAPSRDRSPAPVRSSLPRDVVEDVRATARGERAGEALRLLERAVDALGRDRPAEAVRAGAEAKGIAPRSSAVRETLGLALYRAERYREALGELQTYRRITGRSDQNHLIADCHRALGAPEKSLPLVREAMAAPIGDEVKAEAAVVGGAALADMGRFEEALAMLRRFPTSSAVARPHDLRVWYVTGDVLERAGRPRDAAREFRRILRHDADAFDVAERLAALS
jgi:tetratricopeptide (TPR) repeat protein